MTRRSTPSTGASTIAIVMAAAMAVTPHPLLAGDLNAEVNTMFNNLGAIGN